MPVEPGAKDGGLQELEESLRRLWEYTQPVQTLASCASRPGSELLLELAVGPDLAERGLGSFA